MDEINELVDNLIEAANTFGEYRDLRRSHADDAEQEQNEARAALLSAVEKKIWERIRVSQTSQERRTAIQAASILGSLQTGAER